MEAFNSPPLREPGRVQRTRLARLEPGVTSGAEGRQLPTEFKAQAGLQGLLRLPRLWLRRPGGGPWGLWAQGRALYDCITYQGVQNISGRPGLRPPGCGRYAHLVVRVVAHACALLLKGTLSGYAQE